MGARIAKRRATGWTAGVLIQAVARYFYLLHFVQTGSGAHPASYPMATECCYAGVKRPRRDAGYSPPCIAEVKNTWIYTSTPTYVFMLWYLIT
jgi:hypothetical protein